MSLQAIYGKRQERHLRFPRTDEERQVKNREQRKERADESKLWQAAEDAHGGRADEATYAQQIQQAVVDELKDEEE